MEKVLIVVDMQNDFINGSLGSKEAQAIVDKVVAKIQASSDKLILFTKDTHYANYLTTQEGHHLPVEHCLEGSDGWSINKKVRKAWESNPKRFSLNKVDIIRNTFYKNGFSSVKLAEAIAELPKIKSIEVVGLCTDVCVISTALFLKVYFPEKEIIVDAGCCAGITPEGHAQALEAMKVCQVKVINQ